jgi:lipoyl(octanoyl) transferase
MDLTVKDIGSQCHYADVFDLQRRLHADRVAGAIGDTLLLLEHAPVYTLGTSASSDHLLYNKQQLAEHSIELVKTSRGGDITYHGPGQLVGYPIVHLGMLGLKVLDYLTALEECLIRCVATYGVTAARDRRNRGVWVGDSKLAAIGIRVSRQVTMHGFSLNVNPCMADYSGIIACGLPDVGVTSLVQLVNSRCPTLDRVKMDFVSHFTEVFGYVCC